MALEKPAPLMIDGKAYYTLTSYDPVSITVDIPYVSDDDVEIALEALLQQGGHAMSDLDDESFVKENFEGCSTKADVLSSLRKHMEQVNQQMAEDAKPSLVAQKLAERLAQSVPDAQVARVRQGIELELRDQIGQQGGTWAQFVSSSGGQLAVDDMLDKQAQQVAEQDAALAAYAQHEHLKVERNEVPHLLGIPLEHAQEFLDQVEAAGQMDDFVEGALRSKAVSVAVAQCSCTYTHETPEAAAERVRRYRELQKQAGAQDGKDADGGRSDGGDGASGPRLKLV